MSNAATSARWSLGRIFRTLIGASSWLYVAFVLGLWGWIQWSPAESWPSHLFLYGPRWIVAVPVLVLVPLAVWLRSSWTVVALVASAVGCITIWGWNVPVGKLWPGDAGARPKLRLLTCNVQYGDLRTGDLAKLIREVQPDLVLLQECDLKNLPSVLGQEGWHVRSATEFCLASRLPIERFETLRRPDKSYRIVAVRAALVWSGQRISIVAVHLMTPRDGLEAVISAPLRGLTTFREVAAVQRFESGMVRRWVEECPDSIVVAGDFNLTVEHPLYRHDWSGYTNAFSRAG
jgi:vancomycin resistance protein VanJ